MFQDFSINCENGPALASPNAFAWDLPGTGGHLIGAVPEDEKLWRAGRGFVVRDLPWTEEKLRAMLNVYFNNGGQELQINVVDTAMLRAAQKDPDQYRDLVVRVAGFSEFFVNLTPDMQEEIIARAEHL